MNLKKLVKNLSHVMISLFLGLLVGAIIIILSKQDPLHIYGQMFYNSLFKPYYLFQTLTRSIPIITCAIATAIAWRAGYINIGVEGQMIVGAFVTTIIALYMPGPDFLVLLVSILSGMIAGAIYAFIPAILNAKYQVSIVISTLMMNYIASYVTSYLVNYPFIDPKGDGISSQTGQIKESLRFLRLAKNSTLNISFIFVIILVLLFIFMTKKTIFGYESKMTGLNPNFAKYGGINDKKLILKTMALSGAVAALAGIFEVYGLKYRYIDGMFVNTAYAWSGLMSALIASLNPIGIFFSSIFLSSLQVGGQAIQRVAQIPLQLAMIIQSCITLFVSMRFAIKFLKRKGNK